MDAQTTPKQTAKKVRRLFTGSVLSAVVLAGGMTGTAMAKEIGSGGGTATGGTTVCNPVANLTVKSDPKVGETGLALTSTSYSVKACTNGQVLRVEASVRQYLDTSNVLYDNTNAPLNGKFDVAVKLSTTYIVKVEAFDAVTGASAGSLTAYTAAVPKGV